MKNCEALVSGPLFAIETTPLMLCCSERGEGGTLESGTVSHGNHTSHVVLLKEGRGTLKCHGNHTSHVVLLKEGRGTLECHGNHTSHVVL
jgi:hypothetical protein